MADPTTLASAGALGGLLALGIGMFIFILLIAVGVWIYTSLAFVAIAKKAKQDSPGLAWIPGFGPLIVAFKAAEMPAWPWFLLIGFIIPILNFIVMIAFGVFTIIWQWKMFEKIGKPGWWEILCLISPINLVMWGIAAWGSD